MRLAFLALLPLAALGCAAEPTSGSEDLVGGRVAGAREFPATVLLNDSCTAAKVGPRHILTAAHCVHDADFNHLRADYAENARITIDTAKLRGTASPEQRIEVEIERTVIHPAWLEHCAEPCQVNVLGEEVPPDVAVVVLKDETPNIPMAPVDLYPVAVGDPLVVVGSGCEQGVGESYDYDARRQKVADTRAVPGSSLDHENSELTTSDPRYPNLAGSYFLTPGYAADETSGSLCPGDSGGPVYRRSDFPAVVGVNAYYSFDASAVAETNWHTRLDAGSRFGIGPWLEELGVWLTQTDFDG